MANATNTTAHPMPVTALQQLTGAQQAAAAFAAGNAYTVHTPKGAAGTYPKRGNPTATYGGQQAAAKAAVRYALLVAGNGGTATAYAVAYRQAASTGQLPAKAAAAIKAWGCPTPSAAHVQAALKQATARAELAYCLAHAVNGSAGTMLATMRPAKAKAAPKAPKGAKAQQQATSAPQQAAPVGTPSNG